MPIYEYECSKCRYYVEVIQKISDAKLKKCPSCGKNALQKLISAPVFRLKGSGWYETDFKSDQERKRNLAGAEKDETPASDKDSKAPKDAKDVKDAKDSKDSKESTDSKAAADGKDAKSGSKDKDTAAGSKSDSAAGSKAESASRNKGSSKRTGKTARKAAPRRAPPKAKSSRRGRR